MKKLIIIIIVGFFALFLLGAGWREVEDHVSVRNGRSNNVPTAAHAAVRELVVSSVQSEEEDEEGEESEDDEDEEDTEEQEEVEGRLNVRNTSSGYTLDINFDEAVNKIIENTSRDRGGYLEDYLTNTETREGTLKKMLKAELVTQYPDLRKRDKIGTAVDDDDFQGAIKFERHKEDGTSVTLEFIPIDQFGTENAEESILDYFSINDKGELVVAYQERKIKYDSEEQSKQLGTVPINHSYNELEGDHIESNIYFDYSKSNNIAYTEDIDTEFENNVKSGLEYYKIKTLNYKDKMKKYTMPFEYLWAFLVMGEDEEFVNGLADLVLDSSITIGIYDNTTMTETEVITGYNQNEFSSSITVSESRELQLGESGAFVVPDSFSREQTEDTNITVSQYYNVRYEKSYTTNVNIVITDFDIWYMNYTVGYQYNVSDESNPNLEEFQYVRLSDKDEIFDGFSDPDYQYTSWTPGLEEGETSVTQTRTGTWSETKPPINNQYFTSTAENKQTKKYVLEGNPEVKEKTNKEAEPGDEDYPNFCILYINAEKGRYNIDGIESWLFETLEKNESTVDMVDLTKYLLYCALDKDFGVTEFDFKVTSLSEGYNTAGYNIHNLETYLRQFSGAPGSHAEMSEDGRFYRMIGDGIGWPTIGDADLQWKSVYTPYFEKSGLVIINGEEKTVDNIAEEVNKCLNEFYKKKNGVDDNEAWKKNVFSDRDMEELQLYIDRELVDKVGNEVQQKTYNDMYNEFSDLELSKQQIYSLIAIKYNFGSLPIRQGKSFRDVYEEGLAKYEINSYEHNRYIWDNWWCYVGGGEPGHVKSRDAQFETYVKGVYDFAGKVFGRTEYIYYTEEQLDYIERNLMNAGSHVPPNITVTRNVNNEEKEKEIFTYEEHLMGGNALAVAYEVGEFFIRAGEICYAGDSVASAMNNGRSCIWNSIEDSWQKPIDDPERYGIVCATYVSFVLWKSDLCTIDELNAVNYNWVKGVESLLEGKRWEKITNYDDLQEGDVYICFDEGHIAIYAGNGQYIDQGYCAINSNDSDNRGKLENATRADFNWGYRPSTQ